MARTKKTVELDARREEAMANLDERQDMVLELVQMTETPGWKRLYKMFFHLEAKATEVLKEAERPREMIRAQEAVKLISGKDGIFEAVRRPVRLLNCFGTDMPLFKSLVINRAIFDEVTGVVSLESMETEGDDERDD